MKRWLLALLLCPGLASLDSPYVDLLKLAVSKKHFDAATLVAIAESDRPVNPIDLGCDCGQTQAFVYRQAFARTIAGAPWESIRTAARALVAEDAGESARREVARDDTRGVPWPTAVRELSADLAPYLGHESTQFTHDGKRHIAVAIGAGGVAVYDAATLEATVISHPQRWSGLTVAHPFVRDGKPYLIYETTEEMGVMDVEGKKIESSKTKTMSGGIVTFDKDGKTWAAGIVGDRRSAKVELLPLSDPTLPKREIDISAVEVRTPKLLAGQTHLAITDQLKAGVTFLDPKSATRGEKIEMPDGIVSSLRPAVFFERAAGSRLLVATRKGVAILDPATNTIVKEIAAASGELAQVSVHGGNAILANRGKVTVIDLDTERVTHVFDAPLRTSFVDSFENGGKRLLVWGDATGKVTVADPASGAVIIERAVAKARINEVIPLVRENGFDALILPSEGAPIHGRLLK